MATTSSRPAPLLGPGDPLPYSIENADGAAPVVLLCDHASHAIPASLNGLGLKPPDLDRHIAWDRGAAQVTRLLAERLDAPAVLAGYSRLVIDCNRRLDHETSIVAESDGTVVPGNSALTPEEIARRIEAIFDPYHRGVAEVIARIRQRGDAPAIVAIHSFTPEMEGVARPWQVCVLWNSDPRIPVPLLAALRDHDGLVVGDNVPYSGQLHYGYSIEVHASKAGLPNALIEIREDQICDDVGVRTIAATLGDALETVLGNAQLYRVEYFR